jgi:hypothetical protein
MLRFGLDLFGSQWGNEASYSVKLLGQSRDCDSSAKRGRKLQETGGNDVKGFIICTLRQVLLYGLNDGYGVGV